MAHRHKCLCHNVVGILNLKIIIVNHSSGGRVFNGQHSIICPFLLNLLHGLLKGGHMIKSCLLAKILQGCCMAISSFHPLIDYPRPFCGQGVYLCVLGTFHNAELCHLLILKPAADGHNLRKQLLNSRLIILPVNHTADCLQFLPLPLTVIHWLSHFYFVIRHILTNFHPLLKQSRQLSVNIIQPAPALLQIHVYPVLRIFYSIFL